MEADRLITPGYTDHDFIRDGEGDGGEEDHVAGLVAQIHAILEEDNDDNHGADSNICYPYPNTQLVNDASPDPSDTICGAQHTVPLTNEGFVAQNRAMELLYLELVRLKMEELSVAQQRLALYQKALLNAGYVHCNPTYVGADNLNLRTAGLGEPRQSTLEMYSQIVTADMCLESNCPKQSTVSTQMFGSDSESDALCSRNYPVKAVVPQAGRYFRESGGTGVFLPRCKSGTRNLRVIDNRRKLDAQMPARCTKSVLHGKKKENVSCSSIQYTSYPQMPEVPPDSRSLPPDWMY